MPDPSDVPSSAKAPGIASPPAESVLDALADELNRTFAGAVEGGIPLDKVPLPLRRVPEGTIVGVLFPPEATPDYLICSLGPCIHYSTQVVHLETKNQEVSGDGIAHAERTHWCDYFKRDLDDRIFDCSRWEAGYCPGGGHAWVDGACPECRWPADDLPSGEAGYPVPRHRRRAEDEAKLRADHLAKIRIKPEAVEGFSPCVVCKKLRERSGVIDAGKRRAHSEIGMFSLPSDFCWCGENPETVPTAWTA